MNSRKISKLLVFGLLFNFIALINPVGSYAASVGSGNCVQTVDNAAGVLVYEDSGYCYVAFKNVGTRVWTPPSNVTNIDLLVVAGGGGGGSRHAGGGGAGGLINAQNLTINNSDLTIVVGSGGNGGAATSSAGSDGSNGNNSQVSGGGIATRTAIGGGGGAYNQATSNTGGSGGGGSGSSVSNAGNGTSGQGNNGSIGISNGSTYWVGGGGGGAGGAGTAATISPLKAASGGVGAIVSWVSTNAQSNLSIGVLNNSNVYFAGGGGGGTDRSTATGGDGGIGGGGGGATNTASANNGAVNTGGGGGASGVNGAGALVGGTGGSGVVLIRYFLTSVFEASNYTSGSTTWSNSTTGATAGTAPTGGMTKSSTGPTAVIFAGKEVSNSDRLASSIGTTASLDTVTVEMWIKLKDSGNSQNAAGSMLFSWSSSSGGYNYNIYHYDNQIGFNTFASQLYGLTSTTFNDSWKHLVFVMTDTGSWDSQKIYVDGVNQSLTCRVSVNNCTNAQTRSFNANGDFVLMDNPNASNTWNAKADLGLVRIYNRELTAANIQSLYNLTSPTYQIPIPVNTVLPLISGTKIVAETLTASTGTWNNSPTTFTYQWSKSANSGGVYSNIAGATSSTYVIASVDVDQYLKVSVMATNNGGSETATSSATTQITAASSSASISLAVGTLIFRQSKVISATPSVNGKLTFRANKIIIPGCKNLSALANVAKNCTYRPATRGRINISVTLVPTSVGYRTSVSDSETFFVYQRSTPR